VNLSFTTSKNNQKICLWDTQFIHSSYNPTIEAERFTKTLSFSSEPRYIIFIAPFGGHSYSFLKKRFPNTVLIIIEFFDHKAFREIPWDFYFTGTSPKLGNELFNTIGEEGSLFTEVIIWATSERLFPEETKKTLEVLRFFFNTSRDVLGTRLFFTKKWNTNTVRNIKHAKKIIPAFSIEKPVCIIASGPSLQNNIAFLQKYKDRVFSIALSSSLPVLAKYQIEPNACFTTDGGFWAKMHLEKYGEQFQNTIFIAPLEAALPHSILQKKVLHFIDYGDGFSHQIIKKTSLASQRALRCGTVSGSALGFSQNTSQEAIFFLGLDLTNTKSYPHSQPNALENYNAPHDYRLKPKEDRITKTAYNANGSLALYENWFKNIHARKHKIYRIKAENKDFSNSFPAIKDISENEAVQILLQRQESPFLEHKEKFQTIDMKELKNYLENTIKTLSKLEFENQPFSTEINELYREISLREFLAFQKKQTKTSFLELNEDTISFLTKSLLYLQ
jgi:hypothetical protein